MPTFYNLIEPAGLLGHFRRNPPAGFSVAEVHHGVPVFSAGFDLLTTTDAAVRRGIDRLPFAATLRGLLRVRTCFVGTTVSEYALFPSGTAPDELAESLLDGPARDYAFLIVKDLPGDAVLTGDAAFDWCQQFAEACERCGFVTVEGQALAYVPIDFDSIDEFLMRRSHVRRKNLRRKLRSAGALRVTALPTGDQSIDEALVSRLYELYLNVYRQSEIHFDLLTAEFFQAVFQDASVNGMVFLYYDGASLIGFNLCFREGAMLIDKYIGFQYPEARYHNLYAVSWFHNLEYARANGLRYYVAGWTDPDVKRELGAQFTFTKHLVHVRNPILRGILRPLKRLFESDHVRHGE